MAKYFKLGEKASSFYDPTTKTKLTPGVIAEVDGKQAKSRKLTEARRAGHIVEVDEDDYQEYMESIGVKVEAKIEDDGVMDADKFADLKVAEMKEYLLRSYECTEEEVFEINTFTKKKELTDKYNEFEN